MLRISEAQMRELERGVLATLKHQIIGLLHDRFPEQTASLSETDIAEFVRKSMEAARAVRIDEAALIKRFVNALFVLEYVMQDQKKLKYFAQVMVSENTAEARILFAEKNLLDSA